MQEWKDNGPPNKTDMILLLSNGDRVVGRFTGESLSWSWDATKLFSDGRVSGDFITIMDAEPRNRSADRVPVAWCELPAVPPSLAARLVLIEEERKRLAALEKAPLEELS